MPKTKSMKVYLVGGMEKDAALGAGWRNVITPELEKRGYDVLNPCEFEPEQLKGLQPNRLPESFEAFDGTVVKPAHWHQLKLAKRGSRTLRRFKKYMRRIRNYDIKKIVEQEADFIICHWTKGTTFGAGSHCECDKSFEINKQVYIVRAKDEQGKWVDIPGWIVGDSSEIFESFEELFKYLDDEDIG
jgi:hypothetical protein